MDILMINGSPRKHGNTQMILELFKSLWKEQAEITTLCLKEQLMEACHGCRLCMEHSENMCPCEDDVKYIETLMKNADLIFIGSPVYVEDVSGMIKNWIDRMAYHCHRPFLNGKPVYLFTTSGANASNHAIKTMQHAFLAWGANVLYCDNYSMGAKMKSTDAMEKFAVKIQRRIQLIYGRWDKKRISMISLIGFYVQKKFWLRKAKEDSYDFRYWKSQGWLEERSIYYYPVQANIIKRAVVKAVGWIVGRILY